MLRISEVAVLSPGWAPGAAFAGGGLQIPLDTSQQASVSWPRSLTCKIYMIRLRSKFACFPCS
jgi:hypothetical protein